MARQCSRCKFCKSKKPIQTRRSPSIRRMYFCVHPYVFDLPASIFRANGIGFIGKGDLTADSPLQTKTHPRWCPIEVFRTGE